MEALIGNVLDRCITDAGYRGHNAPPDHKFKVYTSGQKRRTSQIKREFKRRAAIEPVIGHRLRSAYLPSPNSSEFGFFTSDDASFARAARCSLTRRPWLWPRGGSVRRVFRHCFWPRHRNNDCRGDTTFTVKLSSLRALPELRRTLAQPLHCSARHGAPPFPVHYSKSRPPESSDGPGR